MYMMEANLSSVYITLRKLVEIPQATFLHQYKWEIVAFAETVVFNIFCQSQSKWLHIHAPPLPFLEVSNKVRSFLQLFLTVMDLLMKRLSESEYRLHVRGTYMGAAVHADDLSTTTALSISKQCAVMNSYASDSCL